MARTRSDRLSKLSPAHIFEIARLFYGDGISADAMGEEVKRLKIEINREDVYPVLRMAYRMKFLQLHPPLSDQLQLAVATAFDAPLDRILVVDVTPPPKPLPFGPPPSSGRTQAEDPPPRENAERYVSNVAADLVYDLILDSAKHRTTVVSREPVRLGLAPGRATLDFTVALADRVRSSLERIKLRIVAISAGGPARYPQFSSTSFINIFPNDMAFEAIGMFASPLVRTKAFASLADQPGFKEALQEKEEMDIVVTSMGDFSDEHDLLRLFMLGAGVDVDKMIKTHAWLGNVQYRGFTGSGPIKESKDDFRAVTLFELEEFRKRVAARKPTVLIARECAHCANNRARVLYPLMTQDNLKVWTHVVMDAQTARGLLAIHAQNKTTAKGE